MAKITFTNSNTIQLYIIPERTVGFLLSSFSFSTNNPGRVEAVKLVLFNYSLEPLMQNLVSLT